MMYYCFFQKKMYSQFYWFQLIFDTSCSYISLAYSWCSYLYYSSFYFLSIHMSPNIFSLFLFFCIFSFYPSFELFLVSLISLIIPYSSFLRHLLSNLVVTLRLVTVLSAFLSQLHNGRCIHSYQVSVVLLPPATCLLLCVLFKSL